MNGPTAAGAPYDPPRDCAACPRLVAFRRQNSEKFPGYFNGAVPSFGDENAALLIVGLAPGLHGANQTGRPFTGDYAGDLLYGTLDLFGFTDGTYGKTVADGLSLQNARITNAVRCVPPENKPVGAEPKTCRPYLVAELSRPSLRAVLALGKLAHDNVLAASGLKLSAAKFGHGAVHSVGALTLFDSYHCSRYNTNTGRLTPEMFEDVFRSIRSFLAGQVMT
ncbi:MAG: uracil-DNA glycosylase [Alphaproteobacteria bacterium]|nr:uracil-DNA glycosylase [Alphaproteobacteria bacterium]